MNLRLPQGQSSIEFWKYHNMKIPTTRIAILGLNIGALIILGAVIYYYLNTENPQKTEIPDNTTAFEEAQNSEEIANLITDFEGQGLDVSISFPGETELRRQLAQKYTLGISKVHLSPNDVTEHHQWGKTSINGGGDGNEGYYFATDIHGDWELVWDGVFNAPCEELRNYEFPEHFIVSCQSLLL